MSTLSDFQLTEHCHAESEICDALGVYNLTAGAAGRTLDVRRCDLPGWKDTQPSCPYVPRVAASPERTDGLASLARAPSQRVSTTARRRVRER
eukprot:6181669-Pleurochrysis_carterae.AAC.1